jgi:hypothetical protein
MGQETYHENAPEDDDADDVHGRRGRRQGLGKGGKDNENQFEAVHLLAADDISQGAEAELADNSTGRSGELDGRVGGGGHVADARVVDNAKHEGQERDGEDVVRICEEADASHDDGADMVPSEGGTVDLGEGKTPPLIDILNVGEVIVEVVVGVVAARRLVSRSHGCVYAG